MFLVAAIFAVLAPAAAFGLAPLLFGPLHVAAGAVVLARRSRDPRAFAIVTALAALAFAAIELVVAPVLGRAAGSRAELVVGVAWAGLALARAAADGASIAALCIGLSLWGVVAALGLAAPVTTLAALVAIHNVVSIAVGLRARRRSLPPVLLGLAATFALALVARSPGWETIARAIGLHDRRVALAFLYLQLAHYVVWLAEIPELARVKGRVTRPLLALAALASIALVLFAPRVGGLAAARASYLAIAAFHVFAELVAISERLLRPAARAAARFA